jgi:hypothetical protein
MCLIAQKMIKVLAKIDSMSNMGFAMGGGGQGKDASASASYLPGAAQVYT